MGKLFDMDNPLMRFLSRTADIMAINVLTLVCCLPIFTAGAALTAMYDVELRLARGEESYIIRPYFRAFKSNFRQATLEWLIMLAAALVFYVDYQFFQANPGVLPDFFQYLVFFIGIILLMIALWVFPLQCRFENPISQTIKNAAILMIAKAPRTLGMFAAWAAAVVIIYLSMTTDLIAIFPLVFLLGIGLPGYACAQLVKVPFRAFEPEEEELSEEESEAEKEEAYRILTEESAIKHTYSGGKAVEDAAGDEPAEGSGEGA